MKLLYYLFIVVLMPITMYGQCVDCIEPISLRNGNFSEFNGPLTSHIFPCANPIVSHYIPHPTDFYFSNANFPGWFRNKGTPNGGMGFIRLRTINTPSGGGNWCATTGGQKVFAYYPFLKNGNYSVEILVSNWHNYCISTSTRIAVSMENGLSEPSVPADVVEGGAPVPNIGSWTPPSNTWSYSPTPLSFCTTTTNNFDQLSIEAFQGIPETFTSGYVGEPAGFYAEITSVKVKLCNECPDQIFVVNSPSSADPVTAAPFSGGGLFIDAGIDIHGVPFTNNPDENTLLLARWTEIDRPNTAGEAFTASVSQGKFFEIIPNSSCNDIHPCEAITGPTSMGCHDEYISLNSGSSGGTWTSSDPSVLTVSSSGLVTKITPYVSTTVTITYTLGQCILTHDIVVTGCGGKPGGINSSDNSIEVFPNPAQSTITISCRCQEKGLLEISIKDVSGRTMRTEQINCVECNNTQQVIDIHDYAPGVYFVDLTLNGEHTVKKIIKL